LRHHQGREDAVVLALPRGGVPVGFEVARELGLPLEPFMVRKLGVPGHEELAMGAIASGGIVVRNEGLLANLDVREDEIERVVGREQRELERREQIYGGGLRAPAFAGKTVILVDDGLATGSTMRAAVAAQRRVAGRIVVAVPAGAPDTCRELEAEADEVVCAIMPEPFFAVGAWYLRFDQTTDEEVTELLAQSRRLPRSGPSTTVADSAAG
jgi:putative phosphoribosyl transferase